MPLKTAKIKNIFVFLYFTKTVYKQLNNIIIAFKKY